MKKITTILGCFALLCGASAQKSNNNGLPQLGVDPIEKVIAAMTLEEKAALLVGDHEFEKYKNGTVIDKVPGIAGTTLSIPRLGIPATYETDGPAGINLECEKPEDKAKFRCTAFPIASLLASTWNTQLVYEVGTAIGNEALEYGCDVVLAPAINLHRNPLCGRNYEYYSEDPVIVGRIAVAMVNGIQSQNVGTSVKHFAANNQETYRRENDSRISQRALRELYLRGFEMVVRESKPWTIMSSYNRINGVVTQESYPLMTTILRDEWGFNGIVMTDWTRQLRNTPLQVISGNELLMPGFQEQIDDIVACVKNGRLSQEHLDLAVRRMLEFIVRTPSFKKYQYSLHPDLEKHAEITRRSASEGMVLLRNEKETLPLAANQRTIALLGVGSFNLLASGIGSGDVTGATVVNVVDGLKGAGFTVLEEAEALYEGAEDELPISRGYATLLAKKADVAIYTLRRNAGEYADRHDIEGDFRLTATEQANLRNLAEAFHAAGKRLVVVLNSGGVIETASWKEQCDAILLAWQPGVEGGNSITDILTGKVNPSGRLTMTFPVNYADVPASENFPNDFYGDSWRKDWKAWDPYKKNIGYTNYDEGIWVGYRHFNTRKAPVSYPFGYGLSYTTFDYSTPSVQQKKGEYTVTLTVTNSGKHAGKEVVELYIGAPAETMEKPARELKAFAKTRLLQPNESETVTLQFTADDLASFSEDFNCWITEAGTYHIYIGASVEDIRREATFSIGKEQRRSVLTRL